MLVRFGYQTHLDFQPQPNFVLVDSMSRPPPVFSRAPPPTKLIFICHFGQNQPEVRAVLIYPVCNSCRNSCCNFFPSHLVNRACAGSKPELPFGDNLAQGLNSTSGIFHLRIPPPNKYLPLLGGGGYSYMEVFRYRKNTPKKFSPLRSEKDPKPIV